MFDTAVLIGRFQPVHSGHLALLHAALAQARQVVVVVGSAFQARTPKNPFTWPERAALLRACLPEDVQARLHVLPMRDFYDEPRWAQAVQAAVHTVAAAQTAQPRIALVGHFKDASSNYLEAFPEWPLIRLERQGQIDATAVRDAWLGTPSTATATQRNAALAPFAAQLPAPVHQWLHDFAQSTHYPALQHEWRTLRAYRQAWATAPYPPVFVTVDAVLRCQGQVLLVRRAHAPGAGLWALPGGFLEPHDTLWQSCLRELAEETHLALSEASLAAALRQVRVFDHPQRSQRGRTITHVHYFDLDGPSLPAVRGGDDAAHASWVPWNHLPALEEAFFEDHFHILSLAPPGAQCLP